MNSPTFPAGVRSRRVWGVEGEAVGLRPEVLQDDGWRDARQSPDHEEDSQAAAHLLQVQKLRAERGGQQDQLVGAFCTLFSFFLKSEYIIGCEKIKCQITGHILIYLFIYFHWTALFMFLFVFPCAAITVESSFLLLWAMTVFHTEDWSTCFLGGFFCFCFFALP